MPDEMKPMTRPWFASRSAWTCTLLGGLLAWGYVRSGSAERAPVSTVAPVKHSEANTSATSPTRAVDADVRGIPSSTDLPPRGRLIETLRQQIAQSPVLGDAEAQSPLLESLDQAGAIWTKTQRQNREALRQLQRQVRVGDRRQSPHVILVTFDRASAFDNTDSPRGKLFTDLSPRGVSFRQHYAGGESPESGWWTLMTGRNSGRARTD